MAGSFQFVIFIYKAQVKEKGQNASHYREWKKKTTLPFSPWLLQSNCEVSTPLNEGRKTKINTSEGKQVAISRSFTIRPLKQVVYDITWGRQTYTAEFRTRNMQCIWIWSEDNFYYLSCIPPMFFVSGSCLLKSPTVFCHLISMYVQIKKSLSISNNVKFKSDLS